MFTVKQETDNGDKLWPGVSHVYTSPGAPVDAVYGLFEAGGDLQFIAGSGRQMIYVMNENGSTVARYDLGFRNVAACAGPLAGNASIPLSQAERAQIIA